MKKFKVGDLVNKHGDGNVIYRVAMIGSGGTGGFLEGVGFGCGGWTNPKDCDRVRRTVLQKRLKEAKLLVVGLEGVLKELGAKK